MNPMVGLLGARFLTGTSCSSFLFLHVLVSQELDIIPYFCSSFLFLGIWVLVAFSTWKFDMIITLGLASSSFLAIKIRVVLDSVSQGVEQNSHQTKPSEFTMKDLKLTVEISAVSNWCELLWFGWVRMAKVPCYPWTLILVCTFHQTVLHFKMPNWEWLGPPPPRLLLWCPPVIPL